MTATSRLTVSTTTAALAAALVLAAGEAAAAQPAMGTFAADPEHGSILRYTMSGGPRTVVFAEGPPLVRPVAIGRAPVPWHSGVLVSDPGAGAVFLVNETTGAVERTIVAAGGGGLVEPVDAAPDPDWQYHLLVLDGHDGTVRRYDAATGAFLDVAIPGRGRASGMMLDEERVPPPRHWVGRVFIAYPDLGEVACFDEPTGEMITVTLTGPGSTWAFGPDYRGYIVEDRAGPLTPDSIHQVEGHGRAVWRMDLPPGTDPRGVSGSFNAIAVSTSEGILSIPTWGPPILFPAGAGHTPGELHPGWCYADCDTGTGPSVLDIFDFLCFQSRFARADPYACNCDTTTGAGVCDILDFLCFQNWFEFRCP